MHISSIKRLHDSYLARILQPLDRKCIIAEKGRISSFTVSGCKETCDGRGGPICVIERGKTAHAELHFKVGELFVGQ